MALPARGYRSSGGSGRRRGCRSGRRGGGCCGAWRIGLGCWGRLPRAGDTNASDVLAECDAAGAALLRVAGADGDFDIVFAVGAANGCAELLGCLAGVPLVAGSGDEVCRVCPGPRGLEAGDRCRVRFEPIGHRVVVRDEWLEHHPDGDASCNEDEDGGAPEAGVPVCQRLDGLGHGR